MADRDELIEVMAEQAFMSDDIAGHHKASPFTYSPYGWTTIPEAGRENYRRLIREVLDAGLPLIEADLRRQLAAELEERRAGLPINRDNAPLNIALGIARDLVRGATADTDPAPDEAH